MDTHNNPIINKYSFLKGTKLKGKIETIKFERGGVEKSMSHFIIEQESIDYIQKLVDPGLTCRIMTSSGVYTRDMKYNRLNFKVSDEGVITDIFIG